LLTARCVLGPLRTDQLHDLTNYVLNFDKGSDWTLEDVMAVQQFAVMPGAGGGCEDCLGTDIDSAEVVAGIEETPGDPTNGQALYNSPTLGCVGCHLAGLVAPATAGTWTRVQEVRLQDPQFEGYTGEHYLVESILHPSDYIVPGFSDLMPKNFGDKLTQQDLADLVAFLQSQDEPLE
jgi:mono/diheme cytochrome c family protein